MPQIEVDAGEFKQVLLNVVVNAIQSLAAGLPGFRRATPEVWNWTESEHSDGRTRFLMLKGGSHYRAEGSDWYVEGGVHAPSHSVKYLRPGFGLDRGPTIGFRIAFDGKQTR